MNLEDEVSDVLGKALRGLGKDPAEASAEAGVAESDFRRVLEGRFSEPLVRKIAPVLGLDGESLAKLPDYLPQERETEGLRRIELPFREWTVNAWLLEKNGTVLLFDTGWGKTDILSEIDVRSVGKVFITHGHPDHVGGVGVLKNQGVPVISEMEASGSGEFRIGEIGVRAVDLSGHCEPAVGYFVTGFEKQLLVAGDAIFAGSAGGCGSPRQFRLALGNLKKVFDQADEDCLILPGHGPLTSVAEEKSNNPFRKYFS